MAHDPHHNHHTAQNIRLEKVTSVFYWAIGLNFLFVIIESVIGVYIHSISLLTDAGHNLTDVVGLALSLLAMKLSNVEPSGHYTYGYKKTTILVALLNALLLVFAMGAIGYEAVNKLMHPESLPGITISIVAFAGIIINGSTAMLFRRAQEQDLNIRGAFLHLLADALVSAALVAGGIVIYYTGYYIIDAILGIIIAVVILWNTWSLLMQSLRLSMDGVPEGHDIAEVTKIINSIKGVVSVHHIHLWALSTTENALTAHIVVGQENSPSEIEDIKNEVKHKLQHHKITHSTIEVDYENIVCEDEEHFRRT
jgi:cobalt-zinc-cadmium efflux system protein